MAKMESTLYNWCCKAKLFGRKFVYNEEGDVNIVSIVVLCGIAVLLAIVFRTQIEGLISSLFTTISGNATNAVKSPTP